MRLVKGLPESDARAIAETVRARGPFRTVEALRRDYAATGLSLKAHPVSLMRGRLEPLGVTPAGGLHDERQGAVVHVHVVSIESLDPLQPALTAPSRDFH